MEAISALRENFESGATKSIEWRLAQLKAINQILVNHEKELSDAVLEDLGRCHRETYMFELLQLKNDLSLFAKELKGWIAPATVAGQGLMTILDSCQLRREPYGVVLVIGAWN
jgi:aldehyde dehydrogenase (NAD+)